MAVAGDMQAIKEVADRTDGKATQPVGGDSDAPLTLAHEIVIRAAYPKHDAGD